MVAMPLNAQFKPVPTGLREALLTPLRWDSSVNIGFSQISGFGVNLLYRLGGKKSYVRVFSLEQFE